MAEENKVESSAPASASSSGLDPKLAALLSWVFTPVSSIIFMVLDDMKGDDFVQFHAKQSLYWFVVEMVLYFVVGALTAVSMGILSCIGVVLPFVVLGVRIRR